MDKKQKRLRHKRQRIALLDIVKTKPAASLVENKYKVIAAMMARHYDTILGDIPKDKLEQIMDDAIAANREWQWLTQGKDKENKARLEQEFLQRRMRGND